MKEKPICDYCKQPIEVVNPLELRDGKFVHRQCWIKYITAPVRNAIWLVMSVKQETRGKKTNSSDVNSDSIRKTNQYVTTNLITMNVFSAAMLFMGDMGNERQHLNQVYKRCNE